LEKTSNSTRLLLGGKALPVKTPPTPYKPEIKATKKPIELITVL